MAGLRITDLRSLIVQGNFDWVFVRVDTDAGISGFGESMLSPDTRPLETSVQTMRPRLLGEDPFDVTRLVRKMSLNLGHGLMGARAISGIEMALWDVVGKALEVPVYKMLGGKFRDRVRIYVDCHAGQAITRREDYSRERKDQYTPEAYARTAQWVVSQGFTFIKFDLDGDVPTPYTRHEGTIRREEMDYYVGIVREIRKTVGPGIDLALDSTHWPSPTDVIRFAHLIEDYGIRWIEDVAHTPDAFSAISSSMRIPVLTGGAIISALGFRELVQRRAVGIIHPDPCIIGGLWETRKAAELAEHYEIQVAVHNTLSPIGTMAAAHACAAIRNFVALEFHAIGLPWWQDVVRSPRPVIKDGYIRLEDRPGLGVEVNADEVMKHVANKEAGERFFA